MTPCTVSREGGSPFEVQNGLGENRARRIARAQEQNVVVTFHLLSARLLVAARWSAARLANGRCRFDSANKGAHELLVHLWCDGVHVDTSRSEKLSGFVDTVSPRRLNLNLLIAGRF